MSESIVKTVYHYLLTAAAPVVTPTEIAVDCGMALEAVEACLDALRASGVIESAVTE